MCSSGAFRACGREAGDGARLAAFRSPPPPLRPHLVILCRFQRRQVAAALSAAVTKTKQQETAPNSQGRASKQNQATRTPDVLREGARGRNFFQRRCLQTRRFQRRQVTAALSAAVTTIQQQETAPNSQGEPSWSNREPQTPTALREGAYTVSSVGRSRRLCQPP